MTCLTRKKQWQRVLHRGRGASLAFIEATGRAENGLENTTNNSTRPKKVTFNFSDRVVFIPTRREYNLLGLIEELWWTRADYLAFISSSLDGKENDQDIEKKDESPGRHDNIEFTIAERNRRNEDTTGPEKSISEEIQSIRLDEEKCCNEKQRPEFPIKSSASYLAVRLSLSRLASCQTKHRCI